MRGMQSILAIDILEEVSSYPDSAEPFQGLLGIIIGHNSNQVTEALGLGDVYFQRVLLLGH